MTLTLIDDALHKLRLAANPHAAADSHPKRGLVHMATMGRLQRDSHAKMALQQHMHQLDQDLWRGLKDVSPENFLGKWGVEIAPMSSTTDLNVAVDYASEASTCLLFKIHVTGRMHNQGGVDINFLSAFPSEKEFLFPPLTLVKFASTMTSFDYRNKGYEVVEVEVEWPVHDIPLVAESHLAPNAYHHIHAGQVCDLPISHSISPFPDLP